MTLLGIKYDAGWRNQPVKVNVNDSNIYHVNIKPFGEKQTSAELFNNPLMIAESNKMSE